MMGLFVFIGVVSIAAGLFLIFAPEKLQSINELSNRLITNLEEDVFTYRLGVGVSLVVASLLFFFVAYYINARG
jgi:uncharacterized BrkB/YihY/UPF0761 family membrane protein